MNAARADLGSWGRARPVVAAVGALVAASSIVVPWIPVVLEITVEFGHGGPPSTPHIEFVSGVQLLAFALGGSLPGTPQPRLGETFFVGVFPPLVPALAPSVIPLVLLGIALGLLAWAHVRHTRAASMTRTALVAHTVAIVLYWALALAGLLILALNAYAVFSATALMYEHAPSALFVAAAAFACMAIAYLAMLVARFDPRPARGYRHSSGRAIPA